MVDSLLRSSNIWHILLVTGASLHTVRLTHAGMVVCCLYPVITVASILRKCLDVVVNLFLTITFLMFFVISEFRPGEPWKGYPNIDPETDPYVTPGSVINNLSISTVRGVDHLRDRNSGTWPTTSSHCVL